MQVARHPLLDGAAHHVQRARERGADVGDGTGLIAGFSLESENAEGFALLFRIPNRRC